MPQNMFSSLYSTAQKYNLKCYKKMRRQDKGQGRVNQDYTGQEPSRDRHLLELRYNFVHGDRAAPYGQGRIRPLRDVYRASEVL